MFALLVPENKTASCAGLKDAQTQRKGSAQKHGSKLRITSVNVDVRLRPQNIYHVTAGLRADVLQSVYQRYVHAVILGSDGHNVPD